MPLRFPLLFAAAVAVLSLCGCSSLGGGAPAGQAQVVISDVSLPQIEAKAEEVFYRHGFNFRGSDEGKMVFERKGGITENILYGNWQQQDTLTRVTLLIIPKGPTTYALRTRSEIERQTFGGDDDTSNFDIQGARYKSILNKIVQELREENAPAEPR